VDKVSLAQHLAELLQAQSAGLPGTALDEEVLAPQTHLHTLHTYTGVGQPVYLWSACRWLRMWQSLATDSPIPWYAGVSTTTYHLPCFMV